MKLKTELMLMELGDVYALVPANEQGGKIMIRLNETGKEIFEGIEDGLGEADIVRRLTGRYNVDEETVLRDVRRLTDALRKGGFLEA